MICIQESSHVPVNMALKMLTLCTPSRLARFPTMQQQHLSERLHGAQHPPAEFCLLLPYQSVISILSPSLPLTLCRSPSFTSPQPWHKLSRTEAFL
ncbi:hypothetical protein Q8A67_018276 [Cirrhinus molitorella]|uniref:Uncharacterized protein n=1 Tax=Cirrhinus molitorella TaxID=172907 RepID=A0AA88TH80_9TELE|nr:hypothetical protein Q8A67_018276 [Cirrhinus molitorella]